MPIIDCQINPTVKIFHPELVNLYGCIIGPNTTIGPFVEIQRGVIIGANCSIQSHVFIPTDVSIGDNVFIGHGVMFTNDKYPKSHNPKWICLPTIVENNVSIGSGAVILPVKLGHHCKIGAGAVVTKDVEPYSLVVGNPAQPISYTKDAYWEYKEDFDEE